MFLCLGSVIPAISAEPALTLWNAVEISHSTDPGKTYTVEGSDNLKNWSPLHQPHYGNGGEVHRLLSTRTVQVDYQFYRLKVDTAPSGGLAPWSLAGKAFQRSAEGRTVKYVFSAGGLGTRAAAPDGPASMQWLWLRTGADTGRAVIRRPRQPDEILELTYIAPGIGRALLSQGILKRQAAAFGPIPASNQPVLPQGGPEGLNLALADGSGVIGLRFTGPGNGELVCPTGVSPVTCAWAGLGNVGALSVTGASGRQETYQLTFSGPQAGVFERSVYTSGVLRDVDTGAFSFGTP